MQKKEIEQRLQRLQSFLKEREIFAWVELGSDPHASEYPAERWQLRKFFSGFTGSAGQLIVSQEGAYLWSDSRYFIQAVEELEGLPIQFFRGSEPNAKTWIDWLANNLPPSSTIGFDGTRITLRETLQVESELDAKDVRFYNTPHLLEKLGYPETPLSTAPIGELDISVVGNSRLQKLQVLREYLVGSQSSAILFTRLDDIAWILNLRGTDVPFNPVFYSYLYLTQESATLFINAQKISPEIQKGLEEDKIQIEDYEEILSFLSKTSHSPLFLDPDSASLSIQKSLPEGVSVSQRLSPAFVLKACKNRNEITNLRTALQYESTALIKFYSWLEERVASSEKVDEILCQEQLIRFRKENPHYLEESFATISAFGKNGALCHYRAKEESNLPFTKGMYLLDCGGQYTCGTTDLTRTIAIGGEPSVKQKRDYTLVLKGHVALSMQHFPEGIDGSRLDSIARQFLWNSGLDYGHGTGHGVGFCLNVHEGPQRISPALPKRPSYRLLPGMLCSNEPGLYREGEYGIRIENLLLIKKSPSLEKFLYFETLSFFPFDQRLIQSSLLTRDERDWIDAYHKVCRENLLDSLNEEREREWLENATRPLPEEKTSPKA